MRSENVAECCRDVPDQRKKGVILAMSANMLQPDFACVYLPIYPSIKIDRLVDRLANILIDIDK